MTIDPLDRVRPIRSRRRFVLLSALLAIATAPLHACADSEGETTKRESPSATAEASERGAPVDSSLEGIELVYRFASGRTYRAAYGLDRVTFELLEPRLEPPPGKTMPYTVETLRPNLYLVVWADPEFHTTFVVDLERRRVYASALRDKEGLFVATAEILKIER